MENTPVFKQFADQKHLVLSLRAELRQLYDKLQPLVLKRNECHDSIGGILDRVRQLRVQRDELTGSVRKHKDERAQVQEQIRQHITAVTGFRQEKVLSKEGLRNPRAYEKEIEKIEFHIQTEVMNFSKEQGLMKKIKELRKKAEGAATALHAVQKVRGEENTIKQLKKQSEDVHSAVQKYANESQQKHEEMQVLLKEVDALREQKKLHEKEIKGLRKLRDDVRKKLESELEKLNELSKQLGTTRDEQQKQHKERVETHIAGKMKTVEEKLKKGEKLTTQDLLAWQMGG